MTWLSSFCSAFRARVEQGRIEHPSDHWYLLVDAAQLPHSETFDWAREAQRGRWGNLLLANPEGKEADLTAWLVPLSLDPTENAVPEWLDVEAYPFAGTWIQSPYSLYQIGYHWRVLVDVHLPDKKMGVLRFYDACALQHLSHVLDGEQWKTLTAPVRRWIFCDRTGQLQCKERDPAPALASYPLELSEEQFQALQARTHADRIILNMKAEGWLTASGDPFAIFERVSEVIQVAELYGIYELRRQYEFAVAALPWPREMLHSDELGGLLRSAAQGGDSLAKNLPDFFIQQQKQLDVARGV